MCFWIDDMFMIIMVQVQVYCVMNDWKYIDCVVKEMVFYFDMLQKLNGFFYYDLKMLFFWGWGNGWMVVGVVELLCFFLVDNLYCECIMKSYKLMMEILFKYQSEDGMWCQLIDDFMLWFEMLFMGMFVFVFILGVKEGWFDEKIYVLVVRKVWFVFMIYIDEKFDVCEVCQGMNIYDLVNKEYGFDGCVYYLVCQ